MTGTLRILHVEDQERDVALLTRHLTRAGYELTSLRVETAEAMRAALKTREWDVILCDYSMPKFSALEALFVLKETGLDIPLIIISGTIGEELAVEAMRAGASDYLMKDNLARLAPTIERELQEAENRRARRAAEDALRESEHRLRVVTDTARVGLVMIDEEHRYRYANRTYAEIFGLPADSLVGRQVSEVLAPQYAEQMRPLLDSALQCERANHELVVPPTEEGKEERYYEMTCEPGSDREGAVVVIAVADITERKRAEKQRAQLTAQIERQRQRLNNIIDNVPGNVWEEWVEPDPEAQRVNFTSDYIETMTGYEPEEWLAVPGKWLRIVHPEDRERVEQAVAEGAVRGQGGTLEFRWIAKDGSVVWVEARTVVIKDDEGYPIGMRGVTMDITERKRAEAELKRSEERYRDLVENAHDIIYTHDLQGNYMSVNNAGERITGYTREESLQMNLEQTVATEYLGKARQMLARKLAGEEITAYDLEIIAKNGRRIPVEVNTRIMYQDGKPVGVQGIARDVTERKHLEAQLRQAQKMEAVGQLAGGVAHDFNNLLTAITGYSDLTLRKLKPEDPLRHNIVETKRAGERAAALTRQLLAFSRKQVLQPKILDLNTVVAEMEKMLQRLIGEDIDLKASLRQDLGRIKADPGQIEQVLMNLVVNARDAMPGGGRLTIETDNVYLDEDYARQHVAVRTGPYVMLAVSDTGTGIDEETRARIFEPFFTTKEAGKGTGLGLSTVYGIVKQSGGNIWVYSEVGRGTTFKVYLPRMDDGVQEYSRSSEAEDEFYGTETILLAEDEELVRKLAREVLEMFGYHVLEAPNGGAALLICERHEGEIHMLLTDVVMPEMSGRELADRLVKLRPEMQVLFMSGYTDNAMVHQGVLDAETDFIQKPFAPEALAGKVRKVLDKAVPSPVSHIGD